MQTKMQPADRILSIDLLRGAIMIIMALDHVRDFFHITAQTADPLDLSSTSPLLFLTRWVTHFCAPVFVFLSGVSAYLSGRNKSRKDLSDFLLLRGLWLVLVDAVLISLALSFDPAYHFVMLTVFWAIGCSMVLLGLALKISSRIVFPIGILLFIFHDYISTNLPASSVKLLTVLFNGLVFLPISNSNTIAFLYPILPWTGVMFIGYFFGQFIRDKKMVLATGACFICLFLLLRFIDKYGDPRPWQLQHTSGYTLLSFINTSKYPPSLQFLCMTLGPALLSIPFLTAIPSKVQNFITTYGAVPFFYYVSHLILAHFILVAAFFLTRHGINEISDKLSPFLFRPHNFGFSLPVVYIVWISVVLILYYPCRWFKNYKQTHKNFWLRYL